ncbi:iron-containing alcohol dehydrogenase [Tissierella creatinophila]|uniref:NADH-dependent butanol dehydrogenase A n=1 Tax=Tissierella creatinophila DSM 6911 TaxID=1123403 RepID=A0A1U7M806_TISCR|nr:iron-containing alcohol dehydrogenase [Tissierella creatinophila]OLS03416.1 NADH-dependent butanol dehydrogenase A [Tissierella creatinophila DSM 6911]
MKNFDFQIQTRIIFGKDTLKSLEEVLKDKYKNILIHYGGGSIKRSGLYDEITSILEKINVNYYELGGVEPNPKLSLVQEGIAICKEKNIDLILAVGGGSAIDSAKAIGIGAKYDGDVWDFFTGKEKIQETIPVGVVLTFPATGSEMSTATVVTKEEGSYKRGAGGNVVRPVFAIMDPKYTLTLPDEQTFAGIMDIISHIFERYFTNTPNVDFIDSLSEGAMKSIIKNAYILKKDTQNYPARAEIMLSGSIAHNDLLGLGREDDWASHDIGHEISAIYGTTHGVTLAIIFPAWMKYVYRENIDRFAQFGREVFGVKEDDDRGKMAIMAIEEFENFLKNISLPTRLSDIDIDEKNFELMATKATEAGPLGSFKKLYKEDVLEIYKLAK